MAPIKPVAAKGTGTSSITNDGLRGISRRSGQGRGKVNYLVQETHRREEVLGTTPQAPNLQMIFHGPAVNMTFSQSGEYSVELKGEVTKCVEGHANNSVPVETSQGLATSVAIDERSSVMEIDE